MTDFDTKKISQVLFTVANAFALPFEKNFVPTEAVAFASNNWPLAIGIVVGYLIFITVGSRVMQNMKAFDIRLALAGWNALLCLFSFVGMCKTVQSYI